VSHPTNQLKNGYQQERTHKHTSLASKHTAVITVKPKLFYIYTHTLCCVYSLIHSYLHYELQQPEFPFFSCYKHKKIFKRTKRKKI